MKLFSKKEEDNIPAWVAEVEEASQRLFVFYDKLEEKIVELCEAAIPELKELNQTDEDIYKRNFGQVLSGVRGQLDSIQTKSNDVFEDKIDGLYYAIRNSLSRSDRDSALLDDFITKCRKRKSLFDELLCDWADKIKETAIEDYEVKYQKILDEYEQIKDKFACSQCGGRIVIEKILFINTFLTCPYCRTQNTFYPSTQAKQLQSFAMNLAIQRTSDLYNEYKNEQKRERDLYLQAHKLKLSMIHESDKNTIAQKTEKIQELVHERNDAERRIPQLHRKFIIAKYTEWKKIIPDFEEHLNKRMENELSSIK